MDWKKQLIILLTFAFGYFEPNEKCVIDFMLEESLCVFFDCCNIIKLKWKVLSLWYNYGKNSIHIFRSACKKEKETEKQNRCIMFYALVPHLSIHIISFLFFFLPEKKGKEVSMLSERARLQRASSDCSFANWRIMSAKRRKNMYSVWSFRSTSIFCSPM